MGLSTHVLDTSAGRPAAGVAISLSREDSTGAWLELGGGITDRDGRVKELLSNQELVSGTYRLVFDTGAYFGARGIAGFYPSVEIRFEVRNAGEHHHVPLLLSPFGYATYRGT